jgi:GntR family transcriptional regulator/MocR family aminotransferase
MRPKHQTTVPHLPLPLDGHGALAEQIARAIKRVILEGKLPGGTVLPATRALAQIQGVSRETVVVAYELLAAEQLVTARQGSGTRVMENLASARTPRSSPRSRPPSRFAARARVFGPSSITSLGPDVRYNLHYGSPPLQSAFYRTWRRKLAAAALQVDCGYPSVAGHPALRNALCDYLARRRGVVTRPEQVFIVGGTQQAFALLARVLLDEGDCAILEEPWYEIAWRTLTAHGAKVLTVPTDREGLVVDQLPRQGPRLVLVTPSHQFPSGVVMSLRRRLALLEWARRTEAWIVEDDYDSEFRYQGTPPPALRSLDMHDRVVYLGTFSKTMFPSMRLGYVVCPESMCDDFLRAKRFADMGCPSIEQAALATFVRSRQFERHVERQVRELAVRRNVLMQELRASLGDELVFEDTHAGMHLVAWFTRLDYAGLARLIALARSTGLGLYPIHPSYTRRPRHPGLLMGFASLGPRELREAARLLAQCLRKVLPAAARRPPENRLPRGPALGRPPVTAN